MKSTKKLARKGLGISAVILLLFFLSSCSNLFGNQNTEESGTSEKYVTITGSLNIKGAYPSELLNGNLLVGQSRTAFSKIPTLTPVNFDIKAVNKNQITETYTATVASDCMSYTVAIPLDDSPKTYTIQANVSGDYGIFLTTETDEFTISIDDAVNQNLNLTLKAAQTPSTVGLLQLTVSIAYDSGIKSGRLRYKENGSEKTVTAAGSETTTFTYTVGSVSGGTINSGISSGAYQMSFDFYSNSDCTGKVLYSFTETVNIFTNMRTDTWVQNGVSPWLKTSGSGSSEVTTCQISKAMVEGYELTDIYVTYGTAGSLTGTFTNPLSSLGTALAMPNNPDKNYTIHVKGSFTGRFSITNTNFKSLTICGESGLDTNGVPKDIFNGNTGSGSGSTLTINTTKTVIIKSLKITGGNTTTGGGINLTKGTLTLAEDALITGNKAETGGGVYVGTSDDAVLNVTSNAKVFDNTDKATTPKPSNVYLSSAKKINVTGPLKKGTGTSAKKAKIGVSYPSSPTRVMTITVTEGYGYDEGGKNASVGPWEYFRGDAFAIELDAYNEACLKATSGALTIANLTEDVALSVDRNVISTTSGSKKITVIAKVTKNGTTSTITAGSGTGKISYAFELRCNGEKVTNSSTYYSTGTNYLTYASGLPAGKYTLVVKGTYNGKIYSGEFEVPLIEAKELNTKPVVLLAGTDGSGGTSATYVEFGNWPQTLKEDNVTVDENITKATVTGGYTYYLGSDGYWYAKCTESKFGSYGTKYANGTTIGTGTKYFKVEPIKWRVLTKTYNHDRNWSTTQKWLLLSEKVLIGGIAFYDDATATRTINGNTVYPNNYEHSKIRAYLNGISYNKNGTSNSDYLNKGFYQIAFDSAERSKILETTLTHNLESTGDSSNPYATDVTTNDRVFLLSKKDCMTTSYGFTNSTSANELRALKLTDWTRANRGHFKDEKNGYAHWALRSPDSSTTEYGFYHVGDEGKLTYRASVTAGTPDAPAICIDPYYGE